jgi:hypothetical protein
MEQIGIGQSTGAISRPLDLASIVSVAVYGRGVRGVNA